MSLYRHEKIAFKETLLSVRKTLELFYHKQGGK
jgi:hypothetical protein